MEDSEPDVFLIREALRKAGLKGQVDVIGDGEAAVEFFLNASMAAEDPCPDIVVLDLNLPKRKGGDVLRELRGGSRCAAAKVVIVTSSNADREEMSRLGADAYFRKPSDYEEFMKLGPIVRTLLDSPNRTM